MAFTLQIKQKKLFGKTALDIPSLAHACGFRYGSNNDFYILQEEEQNQGTAIFYNPGRIGRGIYFDGRKAGFLRRNKAAVTKARVETAGAAVSFTGKKAGAEDFMAQYPFEQFKVEPVNAVPTGVYELARWRSSTAVVGHRTRSYSQATTNRLWAMTGHNEYYLALPLECGKLISTKAVHREAYSWNRNGNRTPPPPYRGPSWARPWERTACWRWRGSGTSRPCCAGR